MAIIVEGHQKASFSIATIPRSRVGRYSFPLIAPLLPLIRTLYLLNVKQGGYQVPFLKSLVRHDLGLNPGLPDLWRTLYPQGKWAGDSKTVVSASYFKTFQHQQTLRRPDLNNVMLVEANSLFLMTKFEKKFWYIIHNDFRIYEN